MGHWHLRTAGAVAVGRYGPEQGVVVEAAAGEEWESEEREEKEKEESEKEEKEEELGVEAAAVHRAAKGQS